MKKRRPTSALRGSANANEVADVDSKRMSMYARVLRPLLNYRVESHPVGGVALANAQHGAGRRDDAPRRLRIYTSRSAPMNYPRMAGRLVPAGKADAPG